MNLDGSIVNGATQTSGFAFGQGEESGISGYDTGVGVSGGLSFISGYSGYARITYIFNE